MWLLTPFGFFSIVQKPDDEASGSLTIRARVASDLDRFREQFLPGMGPTKEHGGTDYRFRAKASRGDVAKALAHIAEQLDYSNFKDEVGKRQGKKRASVYGKVWDVLYQMQDDPLVAPETGKQKKSLAAAEQTGKAKAYGGVVIDAQGRVLLRRPKGDFDGYVWTFPKGRPDPGEAPEQAALREVKEETGYAAKIVLKLPGSFDGGTSVTEFFLMSPVGSPAPLDQETTAVKWVSLDGPRG